MTVWKLRSVFLPHLSFLFFPGGIKSGSVSVSPFIIIFDWSSSSRSQRYRRRSSWDPSHSNWFPSSCSRRCVWKHQGGESTPIYFKLETEEKEFSQRWLNSSLINDSLINLNESPPHFHYTRKTKDRSQTVKHKSENSQNNATQRYFSFTNWYIKLDLISPKASNQLSGNIPTSQFKLSWQVRITPSTSSPDALSYLCTRRIQDLLSSTTISPSMLPIRLQSLFLHLR